MKVCQSSSFWQIYNCQFETNTWIRRHLLPNSYLVCDVLEEDREREGCIIQLIQAAVDQRLVLKHTSSSNIQKRHQCLAAPMSDLNNDAVILPMVARQAFQTVLSALDVRRQTTYFHTVQVNVESTLILQHGPFQATYNNLSCVVACFICLLICKVCTIMSKIESATGRGYTISV